MTATLLRLSALHSLYRTAKILQQKKQNADHNYQLTCTNIYLSGCLPQPSMVLDSYCMERSCMICTMVASVLINIRLQVQISAWASSHQGLLSLPSLRGR